jgi:hypothetical protein
VERVRREEKRLGHDDRLKKIPSVADLLRALGGATWVASLIRDEPLSLIKNLFGLIRAAAPDEHRSLTDVIDYALLASRVSSCSATTLKHLCEQLPIAGKKTFLMQISEDSWRQLVLRSSFGGIVNLLTSLNFQAYSGAFREVTKIILSNLSDDKIRQGRFGQIGRLLTAANTQSDSINRRLASAVADLSLDDIDAMIQREVAGQRFSALSLALHALLKIDRNSAAVFADKICQINPAKYFHEEPLRGMQYLIFKLCSLDQSFAAKWLMYLSDEHLYAKIAESDLENAAWTILNVFRADPLRGSRIVTLVTETAKFKTKLSSATVESRLMMSGLIYLGD